MRQSGYAILTAAVGLALIGAVGIAIAQQGLPTDMGDIQPADPAKFYKKPGYSPYAGRVFPTRPLWGDQHVHTGWSVDAGMGGTTLTPEDAVRFARGEEVIATSGQPVRLSRPLDWIVGHRSLRRHGRDLRDQAPAIRR